MKTALAVVAAFASLLFMPELAFSAGNLPPMNLRAWLWDLAILIGVAVIFGLASYAVKAAPFIEEPWKGFILWGILVVAIIIIIYIILGWLGM